MSNRTKFIIHGKSNLVTSETQQYSIEVISINFIIIISLFVFHEKHSIQNWNDKQGPTVPSHFIKGSPETTTKAPWLTSSLKRAVVSCILWGTNRVWCTDFKRLCCHCYVHHVRQTAKSPYETKWVKKRNHHALLCLFKNITWVFLINSMTRWCFVCSFVDIYKLLNLNVVLSLLCALTNTFSFIRWNILFLLDAETVLLDEQTNTLFKGICPVWNQPTMAPTLLVWLDLTNLTDRLWKHWHQLRSSD